MAKILCVTTGLAGMLRASCALCKNLRHLGHQVVYACPYDVKAFVEAQGINYFQLEEISLDYSSNGDAGEIISLWKLEKYESFLVEESFDLVFIDMELHELILSTWKVQKSFYLLSQWFPVWPQKHLPHLKQYALPSSSPVQVISRRVFKFNDRLKRQLKDIKNRILRRVSRRQALIDYAKSVNFPLNELDTLGWPPPLAYRNMSTLHLNLKGLDFTGNDRSSDFYLGPQIDIDRKEFIEEKELKRCQNFVQGANNLIVCLLSSKDAQELSHIKKIIQVVTEKKEIQLLVALGKSFGSIQSESENVGLFQWIHPMQILSHAKMAIIHGGIHTINDCIYFEVPMLVYSGERYDQNGCAARVLHHSIGFVGNKKDDLNNIRNDILKTMSDQALREKLSDFKSELHQNMNDLSAHIEKLLVNAN